MLKIGPELGAKKARVEVADVSGPLTELAASGRLPRPRAILFDWDNTLVDSWVTIHEALNITMAAMDKPHTAPVRLALEPSGIGAGETVWFVGDTGIDIECARNSGCIPVLLGGEMPQEELVRCAPRLVLSDCSSLFRLIQGL